MDMNPERHFTVRAKGSTLGPAAVPVDKGLTRTKAANKRAMAHLMTVTVYQYQRTKLRPILRKAGQIAQGE